MRTKLLLADDSITIQKVVGIIFAGEDYELNIVDNGSVALEKAREVMPDVILVDAVMPGKTGYEVCEEIRRDPALKGTPILLLTGAFEPFDEGKARQSGADDFITKPFESQHLIDKVSGLIELGGQRAAAAPAPAPAAASFAQVPPSAGESPKVFSLEKEAAQDVAPEVSPAAAPEFELEMVEGTADDDLWGAFELEDAAEGEVVEFGESPFEVEQLAAGTEEVEEPFVFTEEAEAAFPETAAEPAGFSAHWEPVEETEFTFTEKAESAPFEFAPDEQFGVLEEEAAPLFETGPAESEEFFVETPEAAASKIAEIKPYIPTTESEIDLQFAPEEEYVPAPETLAAISAPAPAGQEPDFQFAPDEEYMPAHEAMAVFTTPAAPVPAPAVAAEAALGDEQLAVLVAKISRDIIEKIAWEVVPDLAERIITEEIRKIKEGS